MRTITTASLLLVALVHVLPAVGALGAGRLAMLYGVSLADPNLTLLMRHRAVLFGLLGGFLGYAAGRPALHAAALWVAWTSVAAFLVLAAGSTPLNPKVRRVVVVDLLAAGALAMGTLAHWAHLAKPR